MFFKFSIRNLLVQILLTFGPILGLRDNHCKADEHFIITSIYKSGDRDLAGYCESNSAHCLNFNAAEGKCLGCSSFYKLHKDYWSSYCSLDIL